MAITEIVGKHSITASETSNPFVVLPGPVSGIATYAPYQGARVTYQNAQQASGSGVWTFSVLISYNRGGSWQTNSSGPPITLTSTEQLGEQVLPVSPNQPTDSGQIWVQVIATLSGSPVTPTLAYRADLLT